MKLLQGSFVSLVLAVGLQLNVSQPSPINVAQFGGTAVTTGTGASGAGIPRVTVANDSTILVTPPTVTKATQGATGFTTQDLKDAGRTIVTLTADAVTPAASDTLVTVAKLVGDTATAGVTTYPVTSGKTLRVQDLILSFTSSTTTANKVRVRLRTLSSGSCVATSPMVGTWELALPNGTLAANAGQSVIHVPIADGLEFSGATRNICLSAIAAAANGTLSITLIGYEY